MFAARHRMAAALTAVLLAGGCGDLDPAAAQGIARNDVVSELATQLSGSSTRTFTAHYQLTGGARAAVSQAQHPPRTAYVYPGGRLLVSGGKVTVCGTRCTATTAPRAGGPLPAASYADAERAGLVAPATVIALLNTAALDATATVTPRDTTIAGHHATCVGLSGTTGGFSTCVTNDGVLGSFTGTLDGRAVDMAMTDYTERVTADVFATPGPQPTRQAAPVTRWP